MKMNLFYRCLIFSVLLINLSCEAQMTIAVNCVDSETKLPLEGVQVNVNAGLDGDYTKATREGVTGADGRFDASMMIGCAFGCYDIYITYTKEGYQTKKDLNVLEGRIDLIREQ